MAPQRRSQRQQQKQLAAAPDCAPMTDQQDSEPPSKCPRKQTSPTGTATPTQQAAALSQMEAERAARIAANQARLAELELPQLAATLAATAAAATAASRRRAPTQQRGISTKRSRAEQLPMRQSARTRGQAPDPTTAGGIDYEARDGRVVLASFVPERYGSSAAGHTSSGVGAESAAAVSRPPPEPLPFSSRNGDDSTDGHFLQQLQALAAASGAPAAAKKSSGSSNGSSSSSGLLDGDGLMQLRLQASDVAKLTTQGVSCLAFHPSSSKPIIAAADKSGKVGLWDVDCQGGDDGRTGGDGGGFDGVLMFEPHSDYISSLKWLGHSGQALLTGSYDGLVRRLDVATGVWDLVGGVPGDATDSNNWSAGEATPDGNSIYLATSAGQFTQLDTRSSSCSAVLQIANRKVNTLHLHADEVHLVSSASDGTVAVWDVRQLAQASVSSSSSSGRGRPCKPAASGQHFKSSQGAYWEPDGGMRVLSVSFDDTLRIWQLAGSGLIQQATIKHNNNTGRWVMPFRPAWSPAGDAVCVGDLKRGVAVFRDNGPCLGLLSAEALTAIPSRLAMHPEGLMAAATSSGRVHLFR